MENDTPEAVELELKLHDVSPDAAQAFMFARRGIISIDEAVKRIRHSDCPQGLRADALVLLLGQAK